MTQGTGSHLGDRLRELRQQGFIGREAETAIFTGLLDAPEAPVHVLFVHGPGGIGKSTLLREYQRLARERKVEVRLTDGRNVDPTPQALAQAAGVLPEDGPGSWPAERARRPGRREPATPHTRTQAKERAGSRAVLLVDTYEHLASLDGWVRESFIPGLPERTLVVLASRLPPAAAWRADPGWQGLVKVLPLRNLSPDESRDFLMRRAVPAPQQARALEFTHGHPLALSLVADAFHQRPDQPFDPEAAPGLLKALLDHFLDHVPGSDHRRALETCAVVRALTEAQLAHVLTPQPDSGVDAHGLFEWLRGLSFIDAGPHGLFPHDLARGALVAELRWRDRDWYGELHRRSRSYYTARLAAVSGPEAERLLMDYIFLHRDNAVMRPYFAHLTGLTGGGLSTDVLRDTDLPLVIQMLREHEGEESERLARHWVRQQPEGVRVVRGADGCPEGFFSLLALDRISPEDAEVDPATRTARAYLDRHAPLRPGETATIFRHWMAKDSYQGVSPVQNLIFVNVARHYLTTPRLAFTFLPCAEPDFWAPMFAHVELARLREADFGVDGRTYGVYGHDWRSMPPMAWLAVLAERELAAGPVSPPTPEGGEPLLVLSRQEFGSAVRAALRSFTRPAGLASNPLLRSRLVADLCSGDAGADPAAALQALVKEAALPLRGAPRTRRAHDALHLTYFEPASSQEAAAEQLDLPFSTFRRHLAAGLSYVTDALWQRELGASEL